MGLHLGLSLSLSLSLGLSLLAVGDGLLCMLIRC